MHLNIPGPFKTETRKASISSCHKRESIILNKYNLILKRVAMKTWSMYSTSIFNLKINFKKRYVLQFKVSNQWSYIMLPRIRNSRQYHPSKWGARKSDQILKVNMINICIIDGWYILLGGIWFAVMLHYTVISIY